MIASHLKVDLLERLCKLLRTWLSERVMRSSVFAGVLILATGTMSQAAAVTLELSPRIEKEINVTTKSSPGWTPTAEQRQHALKVIEVFLNAVESGRYAEAYSLQNNINKRNQTLTQFAQDAQVFSVLAGRLKSWRVLKVSWTKDPAQGPLPGIYAAVDLAGQFTNMDRHCGYIVLYQQPAGGGFTIMRRESSYIDNATARSIEEKHSKAELTRIWAELSRHCPNYTSSLDGR